MEERAERATRFADMHYRARIRSKKSQEYMALCLGVTKRTIINWEKGTSSPSFFQSLEWFRVLNQNPFPYYLSYIYPDELKGLKGSDSDERIEEAFDALIKHISIKDKRAFLYIYYGSHGSSPYSLIQLLLAHLHTPIQSRIANAFLVSHVYSLHKELDTIICPDSILPDMDDLNGAISKAQEAVMNNGDGYTNVDKNHLI